MTTNTNTDFDFIFTDQIHVAVESLSAFEITNIINKIDEIIESLEEDGDFEDVWVWADEDGIRLDFNDSTFTKRVA